MQKIFPIIKLASKSSEVKRTTGYRDGHFENDSEHSYQLALVCWSANEQYNLGLNNELILKLALTHDLVEIYAGDTDAHDNKEEIASKEEREKIAIEKLTVEYSNFKDMLNAIKIYEERDTDEAKLVYFLDKITPDVNIYNSNSNYYKDRKVTLDGWVSWLFGKIKYESLNSGLKLLVDESVSYVKDNFQEIFYK
ncbi:MAG TPA: HD domain-containing protein [Candidatus Paceibacterota bacterium]|jgi:putative hydrolase of HD superfamily|nr:HD domain-containing protein [Candidatus Paceibacterota bacterium]